MSGYPGHPDQFFGGSTYSQHGEDLLFCAIFWRLGITNPTYLDIGCSHPKNISNTALLYERGSRGVNMDANPNVVALFKQARPYDISLHLAVAATEGERPFYMFDDFSGRNTFSKEEAGRFMAQCPGFQIRQTIVVPTITLGHALLHVPGGNPDLLSIDAEGLDLEILDSHDFLHERPLVVCVEVREGDQARAVGIMAARGYGLLCRMVSNLVFVDGEHIGVVR